MRLLRALIIPLITILVFFLLDRPRGSVPALGKISDPINGWGANAEAVKKDFKNSFSLKGIKQPVSVCFEEDRLVPHIFAQNNADLYFAQGYLHAFFRLWQMEFQTLAAAGRVGEVAGERWITDEKTGEKINAVLHFDRGQRRKGMVYGAEKSLRVMEADTRTKEMLDAYTAGINAFIKKLKYKNLPIEYKLMGYQPEPWTNLKTALLLKYMADDLTGYTEDLPLTALRDQLSAEDFEELFPERIPGSRPVIPEGTEFPQPSLTIPESPADSIWRTSLNVNPEALSKAAGMLDFKQRENRTGIGSNNWAISGVHTRSGAPILCNDPHLGLNLPSLWFEMQLQAPGVNVYGVSLPGAPGIIIGFNDSLSWGLTNNYRDVKDFYEIETVDADFYQFDGRPVAFEKRNETIKIKREKDFTDTVFYTIHGPVMYDERFADPLKTGKKLAVTWMAHRGTNELLAVYLLNRAENYPDFVNAVIHFQCPAQNFAYADRSGNIALWTQGQFINKWKGQGRFVMKGNTSATLWKEDIPVLENPHILNPPQGFLASANQITTDSTYPYWYNGYFSYFRAWRINEILSRTEPASIQDEMAMQQDEVSVLAREIILKTDLLTPEGSGGNVFSGWNFSLDAESETASAFQIFWEIFYQNVWKEKFKNSLLIPSPEKTLQLALSGSANPYRDLFLKTAKQAVQKTADSLEKRKSENKPAEWFSVKGTQLTHLAKLDAFSYKNLKTGGWGNTINAIKKAHGPSWRMVVELDADSIRAYGVYPGGQSGNPGSRYYGNFVTKWEKGGYYKIRFYPFGASLQTSSEKFLWKMKSE